MKKTTTLAAAFIALAGLMGTQAMARDADRERHRGSSESRMERPDANRGGDLTLEEFSAAMRDRLASADSDGDGAVTVEELADQIMRSRAERAARRTISRHDANGDGILSLEEFDSHRRKVFALLDRNDNGVLERDEMKRGRFGRDRRSHKRR